MSSNPHSYAPKSSVKPFHKSKDYYNGKRGLNLELDVLKALMGMKAMSPRFFCCCVVAKNSISSHKHEGKLTFFEVSKIETHKVVLRNKTLKIMLCIQVRNIINSQSFLNIAENLISPVLLSL